MTMEKSIFSISAIYLTLIISPLAISGEINKQEIPSQPESLTDNSSGALVVMETSLGRFTLQVDSRRAPSSAKNFLQYIDSGFYNGTVFHRVIDGFMVQGGGFDRDMNKMRASAPIANEADNGLKNTVGSIAMARTGDPHSASSQFFINVADNDFLDHKNKTPRGWGYAVFGRVIDGMGTIEKITAVATGRQGAHQNVPLEAVIIERGYRKESAAGSPAVQAAQ